MSDNIESQVKEIIAAQLSVDPEKVTSDELGIGGHFFGINAELSSDDFFYLGFNIVGHKN